MIFSIRAKMIASFLILITLPIIVLGVLSYQKSEALLLDKAKDHSLQTMENARVFFIENFFAETERAIDVFVLNQDLKHLSPSAVAEWDQYRRFHPNLPAIYFGDTQGRYIVSANQKPAKEIDPRDHLWYRRAQDYQGRTIWSGVYLEIATGRPIITVSRAVADGSGFHGVLGIDISLYMLADIVKKIYFEQGGYAILVDNSGLIVAHPEAAQLGKIVTDDAWYWDIRNQTRGVIIAPYRGVPTFISFITIPQTDWKLIGFIPRENVEHELAPIKSRTIGVGVLAALLAVLIGLVVASRVAASLHGLVAAMTRVQKGDFSARWQDHSAVEFAEIGDRFTDMVTTLDTLIRQEHATQQELAVQKEYFAQLFHSSPESIAIIGADDRIVEVNQRFTQMFGYSFAEVQGRFINDLVVPEELRAEGDAVSDCVVKNKEIIEIETMRMRKDGQLLDCFVLGYPIVFDGEFKGGYIIYRDISERKEAERRLTHASTHDLLTGTFNRSYFEQQMQRLDSGEYPAAGIIISDIDGLKLVNDTLGHAVGDDLLLQAARIMRENVPDNAVLCRIGGDEFAVLLATADEASLQEITDRIKAAIAADNLVGREYVLSISVGFAVRAAGGMDEAYREADSSMYREKLHRSNSARSALVKTLTEALHARDFITEGHADRLQELVEKLARAVGIPDRRIGDMRLLAQFHDIGKVGIPDSIL
ncbi:MAG TPA: cache domain-containing protein, partial [Negativicutes bacterium]|nr:cache domain-containing protein [Negativicutes bacterium]